MTFNKNDIKSMYSESYPIYPDLWGGKQLQDAYKLF